MQQHLLPTPRNIISAKISHIHSTPIVVVLRADGRGLENQELLRPGVLCQVLDDVGFGAAGPGWEDGGTVEIVCVEVVVGVCVGISVDVRDVEGGEAGAYIRPYR